jgi:hypothetical protein
MIGDEMLTELFSNYYLNNSTIKANKEREEIEDIYNQKRWFDVIEHIITYNANRNRKIFITKDAYKLSKKIKKYLNIEVFPIIFPFSPGYWQKSAGAWSWMMYTNSTLHEIGSIQRTQYLLLKSVELNICDNEIIGEKIKENYI